jgi:DNA-binding NtrC family response regulator
MPKKILIIDDDELFLAVIQIRLEQEGFLVFKCQTGEDGVRLFKKSNPDVVLLDIRLPSMSSDKVFKRIKTLNPDAKIITISAYASSTTQEEQKVRGAASFYDKAMQTEKLIRDIRVALGIQ